MRAPWTSRSDRSLTPGQSAVVETVAQGWAWLTTAQRQRLHQLVRHLLDDVGWEAARGFRLDDGIRTTIAARAALPVVELGPDAYRHVRTIVVHGSTIVDRQPRPGPSAGVVTAGPRSLLGHTTSHGPVFLAWSTVRAQAQHPRGGDVVIHEFAHKLDLLDGWVDGTPPLPRPIDRDRWIRVCTRELEALRAGRGGILRAYAGLNPGEFFAVASEIFFTRPVELRDDKPELYLVLAGFYRQDPASA